MKNPLLDIALQYRDHGFSVIPALDKRPLIKWEQYQKERATSEQIKKWLSQWPDANIQIVTGQGSNLSVIDTDSEQGKEAIQEFIPDTLLMPVCSTPRGGQHFYFLCPDPPLPSKNAIMPDVDFKCEGGLITVPPSSNEKGKYEWLKGLSVFEKEIPPMPSSLFSFLKECIGINSINSFSSSYIGNVDKSVDTVYKRLQTSTSVYKVLELGRRDEDLFHIANCLIKGGANENEVMQTLEILARNCNPPFPQKEVDAKIESALKRAERRERNLAYEVKEWVLSTNGVFLSTDVINCLQMSTRDEKKNLSIILRRLCDEEIIERCGNKNGQFRRIEREIETIDFLNSTDEAVNVKWPFEIESYVKTMPKNIIVIAGVSNAGKTALILNFIEMNMSKFDIHYFSSEMGNQELKSRLSKFERSLNSWKFTAYERSNNFADVIKPDAINIIDYLEIYEEHYKIGAIIKDIYSRLNKGIAIIAIQKKKDSDLGVGGISSIEKARLYLTLDFNRLRIEKGKNWVSQVNPNGLTLDFKLVQGCRFMVQRNWYNPQKKI